jgi:hypothetical protein
MSRRAGAPAYRAGDATEANGVCRRQRLFLICGVLPEAAT